MRLYDKTEMIITLNKKHIKLLQELQNTIDQNITSNTIKINDCKYTNATNLRMFIRHLFGDIKNRLSKIEKELENGK